MAGTPGTGNHDLLTTERLVLRRPTYVDVDVILALHTDPRTYEHNPSDALAHREDAVELFERWNDHWERHGFGYWAVLATAAREPVVLGFCGVKYMELAGRRVLNLFYRLDPACWGRGYATEAATAVVLWAESRLPQVPLIARVRPGNAASRTVAERTGLVRAPELDGPGYDGFDVVYAARWGA